MKVEKLASWKDPSLGYDLELWLIPYGELSISDLQRELSTTHVNKLAKSFTKGYYDCLLVIREAGQWKIIDGQHSYFALGKTARDKMIPCIVAPEMAKNYTLVFNVEKSDDIKARCVKTYNLYKKFLNEFPQFQEQMLDEFISSEPHLLSLAFAHVEFNVTSPSLVETTIKKFDGYLEVDLAGAVDIRRDRGDLIYALVRSVEDAASTFGITDYHLKGSIISKTNSALWERKRTVGVAFDEGISMMVDYIGNNDWGFLGAKSSGGFSWE